MAKRSRKRSRSTQSSQAANDVSVDLSEEYSYVIEDLQRIGIIAVILVAGLVVLSFFL